MPSTIPLAVAKQVMRRGDMLTAVHLLRSNASLVANPSRRPLADATASLEAIGLPSHGYSGGIVHVAGTKGKGSTCTFAESILRDHGLRTILFTSPHLLSIEERIKFDGFVNSTLFAKSFWDVWNRGLEAPSFRVGDGDEVCFPGLFKYTALMAMAAANVHRPDALILEVGIGGAQDTTNVVIPTVCGITKIDRDHIELLGNSVSEIARRKAGIMKPGVPCFAQHQVEAVEQVFEEEADRSGAALSFVSPLDHRLPFGIPGPASPVNAALAVAMSKEYLQQHGHVYREDVAMAALSRAKLAGRFHSFDLDSNRYFLDGAHTPASVELAVEWFLDRPNPKRKAMVLCSLTGRRGSRADEILAPMAKLSADDKNIDWRFVGVTKSVRLELEKLFPKEDVRGCVTIRQALAGVDEDTDVFVVGSIHLIGDALKVLAGTGSPYAL